MNRGETFGSTSASFSKFARKIGTAVNISLHFDQIHEGGRPVSAPPSSIGPSKTGGGLPKFGSFYMEELLSGEREKLCAGFDKIIEDAKVFFFPFFSSIFLL